MKKITFLILILTVNIQAKAQDILGTWYAIGKNHLAEFVLSEESIKIQMVESESDSIGHERGNIKHFGIYEVKDKNIVIVQDKNSVSGPLYLAMTFFDIKNGVSIEMARNGITIACGTVEELINLTAKDTTKLFGNVFFHKDYLQVLRSLRDLESMPVDEFKTFLRTFIDRKDKYSDREQYIPGTFQDQIINSALIEIGFNPINRSDWFDRFLEKYLTDKEVERLWRKM